MGFRLGCFRLLVDGDCSTCSSWFRLLVRDGIRCQLYLLLSSAAVAGSG